MIIKISIILVVLIQGGFFPNTYLLAGMLYACLLLSGKRKAYINIPVFTCFAILLLSYILSGLTHNFSMSEYKQVFQILACIFLYFLLSEHYIRGDNSLWDGIIIGAIISAYAGIMAYIGFDIIPDMISRARLQGLMQYANATAIYLSMGLLLINDLKKYHWAKPGLLIALQLTISVGGILAYIAGVIIYSLLQKRGNRIEVIIQEGLEFVVAACFAAAIYISLYIANVKPLGAAIAIAGCIAGFIWKKVFCTISLKKWLIIPGLVLGLLEGAGVFLYRGKEAAATFAERIMHSRDGIKAIMSNPLFGLGPGRWAIKKAAWQSMDYRAQLIHNSYIQIAVNAGIPALICVFLIILLWFNKKGKKPIECAVIGSLLLHGLIDCSFYFTGIILAAITIAMTYRDEIKQIYHLNINKWIIKAFAGTALAAMVIFYWKYVI